MGKIRIDIKWNLVLMALVSTTAFFLLFLHSYSVIFIVQKVKIETLPSLKINSRGHRGLYQVPEPHT
jgi:hypothetical protein